MIDQNKIKVGLKFKYISRLSSDIVWEIMYVGEQKVFAKRSTDGYESTWSLGHVSSSPSFTEYVETPKVGQTYRGFSSYGIVKVFFLTDKSVAYRYLSPDTLLGTEAMMSIELFQSHFERCNS